MFKCALDGIEIEIILSNHSRMRMAQRKISSQAVYGTIVAGLEQILDMKSGEDFVIVDRVSEATVVASVTSEGGDIYVEIITVVDNLYTYARDGQKIINL